MWECFHASLVEAVSQSHTCELITGSFIQSHCPCMTLWPISMFSRILASESTTVPASQAGGNSEGSSSARPPIGKLSMQRDHAADVAGVPVAEALEDLVVQLLELAPDRLDLLRREAIERMNWAGP